MEGKVGKIDVEQSQTEPFTPRGHQKNEKKEDLRRRSLAKGQKEAQPRGEKKNIQEEEGKEVLNGRGGLNEESLRGKFLGITN